MASNESSGDTGWRHWAYLGLVFPKVFPVSVSVPQTATFSELTQRTQFIRCSPVLQDLQVDAVCSDSGICGDVKWINYETRYAHLLAKTIVLATAK